MCFLPSMVAYRKILLRAASHTYPNCHFCYFVLEISHPTEWDSNPLWVEGRRKIYSCTNSDECMVQLIIVLSFSNYNCEVPPPYTDHNQFCRLQGFLFSMLSSPYRCKLKWLDEVG